MLSEVCFELVKKWCEFHEFLEFREFHESHIIHIWSYRKEEKYICWGVSEAAVWWGKFQCEIRFVKKKK